MAAPPSSDAAPAGRRPRLYAAGIAAAAAGFALLRLACLRGDLWLDEVWSLRLVAEIHHPWEILTRIRLDNNHPLNSLFLYLLGPSAPDWAYRLLSWAAGSASVWLAALAARRQFRLLHPEDAGGGAAAAGLSAAALFGASYLQVLYSSEARGYAPAVACCLIALLALLRSEGDPPGWRAAYWAGCLLGMLAHPLAVQMILGGAGFGAVRALQAAGEWRRRWRQEAAWHLPPLAAFALYYALYLRPMGIGGATFLGQAHAPLSSALSDAAAYSLGLPAGSVIALPLFAGASLISLGLICRRDLALGAAYSIAIFLAPLPGLLSSAEPVPYARYFVVSAAGALLLLSYLLARLWSGSRAGRMLCLGAGLLFFLGSGLQLRELLREGRGRYREAMRYVLAHSPGPVATVSSDFNDFRNGMMVERYGPEEAGPGRSVEYLASRRWRRPGPEWLLTERLDHEPPPPDHLYDSLGIYYQLERAFPHAPLSGWTWYLYRNTLLLGFPAMAAQK